MKCNNWQYFSLCWTFWAFFKIESRFFFKEPHRI